MFAPKIMMQPKKPSNNLASALPAIPFSEEAERALLAAIFAEPKILVEVADLLQPEMFYLEKHQNVFKAMLKCGQTKEIFTLPDVLDELKTFYRGSLPTAENQYTLELSDLVATSSYFKSYINTIKGYAFKREIIELSKKMSERAMLNSEKYSELFDWAEAELFGITKKRTVGGFTTVGEVADLVVQEAKLLANSSEGINGLRTEYPRLDHVLGGLRAEELIILAARPGAGKTAFAINLAVNVAHSGKHVAFFSLEMSNLQLTQRIMANVGMIDSHRLSTGYMGAEEWTATEQAQAIVKNLNIIFDDSISNNVNDIRAKCRQLKSKNKLDFVVIDYLQLLEGDVSRSMSRENEVAKNSRALKQLARELQVPVLCLSQLSRQVERRESKTPLLSDLRESGAIEQDADVILFIHEPETSLQDAIITTMQESDPAYFADNANQINRNVKQVSLTIAKNRRGEANIFINYDFILNHSKFNEFGVDKSNNDYTERE